MQATKMTDKIKKIIAEIPSHELQNTLPRHVLQYMDTPITQSMRSTASQLLKKARQASNIEHSQPVFVHNVINESERHELAMKLIVACSGNFAFAHQTVTQMEMFFASVQACQVQPIPKLAS